MAMRGLGLGMFLLANFKDLCPVSTLQFKTSYISLLFFPYLLFTKSYTYEQMTATCTIRSKKTLLVICGV